MLKPSERKLSEVARHLVYPDGIVTTNWPRIQRRLTDMAIEYDGWQQGAAQLILGCDSDGRYAATVGGVTISIPRQVGKTFTIGSLLIAMCIEYPGLRVVWTSHHGRTNTNTFRSMQSMVKRKRVKAHLAAGGGIRTANGEQEIAFANESIIMFGAREHGFGVGIDAIDVMVCDEAQRLTSRALADMVPTTNQARHEHGALLFFIGTPPRPDNQGDEFRARRKKALAGLMTNGIYIEMSADEDGDYDDPNQWKKANPSYPSRTPHESMLRMRENLTDPGDWKREAMGVWDEEATSSSRLITPEEWEAIQVSEPPTGGVRSIGVAFNQAGSRVSVACSVKHDHGVYLELVGGVSGELSEGLRSLARWLVSHKETLAEVWIAGGLGKSLALELQALRMPERMYRIVTTPEYFTACSTLYSDIQDRQITVPVPDEGDALDASVAVCDQKIRPSGWGWQATTPDGDETPIEAASVALMAARTTKRRPTGERRDPTGRPASRRGVARGRVAGRR